MAQRRKSGQAVEELEEQITIEEKLLEPGEWEEDWKKKCEKAKADFWGRCSLVPRGFQHEVFCYLYRLEPRVYNRPGEPTYQAKYAGPATRDQVEADWGGGRYEIYLKRGVRTLAQLIFTLDGPPKYKSGQTDATGKTLSGGGTVEKSGTGGELADALKVLVPLLKPEGQTKAAETAVEVVSTGYKAALDAQRQAAAAPNELMMKLVEKALTPPQQQGPDALKLIETVMTIVDRTRPAEKADSAEGLDSQFALVERLTGKKVSDLLAGKGPSVDPWAQIGMTLLSSLPGIIREARQFASEEFHRRQILASNKPLPPGETETVSIASPITPTSVIPPTQLEPPTQEEMLNVMVQEAIRFYRAGWDGYALATSLIMNHPHIVQAFAPILSSREQLDTIVMQVPALMELAQSPPPEGQKGFDEFVTEFYNTLNKIEEEEESEAEEVAVGEVVQDDPPAAVRRRKTKSEPAKPE